MAADPGLAAEIEAELARARDMSETRTVADLREATGAGHDDLTTVLDELREGGKVSEVAPGEYLPVDTNAVARERAAARRTAEADPPEPGVSLAEAERQANGGQIGRYPIRGGERKTTLTAGVASALDAESLGALVKAGIEEAAEASATFVFEVIP